MTTKKEDKECIDPAVEKFVRENRDMIQRLFEEEHSKAMEAFESKHNDIKKFANYHETKAKEVFEEERKIASDFVDYHKQKAQDAMQSVIGMFTDPEFQKHIVSAGLEFMIAMDAFLKAAPLPDFVKEVADKAHDAKDNVKKAYCEKNSDCTKKPKKSVQKIEIE